MLIKLKFVNLEKHIVHPIQVAGILAELKSWIGHGGHGFLYDVVEDTGLVLMILNMSLEKMLHFSIEGVTKLGKIKYKSHAEQQAITVDASCTWPATFV